MTDTTNSSPRPWRVVAYDDSLQCDIYDANGTPVCTMINFSDPQSDAALIVEAVNGHDRLRDIVRRLEDEYEQMEGRDTVCNTDRTRRIEALFREARETLDALPASPRNCDVYRTVDDAFSACHADRGYISDPVAERRSTISFMLSNAQETAEGDNHAKND